jgi:hypothetical protein
MTERHNPASRLRPVELRQHRTQLDQPRGRVSRRAGARAVPSGLGHLIRGTDRIRLRHAGPGLPALVVQAAPDRSQLPLSLSRCNATSTAVRSPNSATRSREWTKVSTGRLSTRSRTDSMTDTAPDNPHLTVYASQLGSRHRVHLLPAVLRELEEHKRSHHRPRARPPAAPTGG